MPGTNNFAAASAICAAYNATLVTDLLSTENNFITAQYSVGRKLLLFYSLLNFMPIVFD